MSSPAPDPTPTPDETSYIKMSTTALDTRGIDASLVGSHCEYAYCHQLDFLPFKCQSCNKTFCLEHRTEDGHKCTNPGAWAARRREADLARASAGAGRRLNDTAGPTQAQPCAADKCKTTVGTALHPGVHCANCSRDYCLKHRLREDHDCANKPLLGARAASAKQAAAVAEGARNALERLRLWGQARRDEAKKTAAKARAAAAPGTIADLNALKKEAKGDAKIAPEKRVYLHVEAEAATAKAKIPKGEFFYAKDWVVGRMLDAAAKSLQVQNVNNQSTAEENRLRVFHVEGGRLLEFNEKVGEALQSGNTVVLLRGVGPAPDLITP